MKTNSPIKPPVLLKTILDIAFWILILRLIGSVISTGAIYFFEVPFDLTVNEYKVTEFTPPIIIGIICKIIIATLFIYIVYLLRKVVRSIYKNKHFTPLQITSLKVIGQLIITTTVANLVLDFLLRLFIEQKAHVAVELQTSFNSFWFTLAIGLFFILLSGAFNYAAGIQKENELTV